MPRRLGKRLYEVCKVVAAHGPCDYKAIYEWHGGISLQSTKRYGDRAVEKGLMTIDRRQRPAVFRIVDGWEDRFLHLEGNDG